MSDEEEAPGFLSRWSRRKMVARRTGVVPEPDKDVQALPPEPPDLPALDTLDAASDFTAFLARGVPVAVQTQALRIAWASDPAIAEFRGMAEYAWDFNAPGYGALAAGDDVAALLAKIVRSAPQQLRPADDTAARVEPMQPAALPGPVSTTGSGTTDLSIEPGPEPSALPPPLPTLAAEPVAVIVSAVPSSPVSLNFEPAPGGIAGTCSDPIRQARSLLGAPVAAAAPALSHPPAPSAATALAAASPTPALITPLLVTPPLPPLASDITAPSPVSVGITIPRRHGGAVPS